MQLVAYEALVDVEPPGEAAVTTSVVGDRLFDQEGDQLSTS